MKYYLDENLSPRIAQVAKDIGIDAVTSIEAGIKTGPDELHLSAAAYLGRCLVTRDRDYLSLARQFAGERKPHAGVLLIYRSLSDDPATVTKALSFYHRLFPDGVPHYTILVAGASLSD